MIKRNKKGITSLAFAVLTAFVLFGLGLVVSMVSSYTVKGERRMEATIRARYLAEAGVALALSELQSGKSSVAISRKLFAGRLRVKSHTAKEISSGKKCVDILSQGVVREQGIVIYARIVPGAPLFSTEKTTAKGKSRYFLLHQFAVPKKALGHISIENKLAVDGGAHTLIDTHFREQREKVLELYRDNLASMGRRGVYKFCRSAIATITGSEKP